MKKPKYTNENELENLVITTNSCDGGGCELRAVYTTEAKDFLVTKAKTVREFGLHAFLAGVEYGSAYPRKSKKAGKK